MGIEKPLEAERGELGPAPGPPVDMHVAERIRHLVRPGAGGGIEIAGHELRVADPSRRDATLKRVRDRLTRRMRERRPNADETAWAHLSGIVRAIVTTRTELDPELERTLVSTIDGL